MSSVISEACIDVLDRSCIQVCCVDAIHFEPGKDRMAYIDPDVCIECYACAAVCPVNAIFEATDAAADPTLPERRVVTADLKYIELNALWFKDGDAARELVDAWEPAGTDRPHRSEAAEERLRAEAAKRRSSWFDRLLGR